MIFAMLIKETRENLRWAGLITLVTAGLLAVGLYDQFSMGMSIAGRTFLNVCLFMYPAAGLAMGMLQVFQDARKGRWQFVSHRPMSPRWILTCKVLAGMMLYFAATLLPLMIVTLWVSVPGHVPGPFSWDMVEQPIADVFLGLIWYAGGLFIAGRQARWIGSRIVPLGAAFVGSLACYAIAWTLMEWIAIAILITAVILLGLFGIYGHEGETERSPVWAKPSIILSLLAGWFCVLAMALTLGGGIIDWFFPSKVQSQPYQNYRWTKDGQLHLQTWKTGGSLLKNEDLSGKTYDADRINSLDTAGTATLYFPNDLANTRIAPLGHGSFFDPQMHLIRLDNTWFYLPGRRTIEKYDQQTRNFSGSIGPDGFADASVSPRPFAKPTTYNYSYQEMALYTCEDAVYAVDLGHNSIAKIFSAEQDDPVVAASSTDYAFYGRVATLTDRNFTVVATRSSLHFLQQNKPTITVPIDHAKLKYNITTMQNSAGQFVVAYGLEYPVGWLPVSVATYGSDGTRVSLSEMPAKKQPDTGSGVNLEGVGALTFTPPALFALIAVIKPMGNSERWDVIEILIIAAIGFTAIAFSMLRARHATRRQMYLWLPFAACFGLVGIFLLMSMLEKTPSARCRSCGKRRLITEDICPNCQTIADGPAMEGVEIFAMPAF